ncbi:MAG: FCD domain-containing protein, partial [Anaeroplasmataceae bacterium]
ELIISKQQNMLDLYKKGLIDNKTMSQQLLNLDDEFHTTMFNFCGRSGIWNYLFQNELHYKRFRIFLNTLDNNNTDNIIEEHKKIIECLCSKDIVKLENIIATHIYGGIRNVNKNVFDKSNFF